MIDGSVPKVFKQLAGGHNANYIFMRNTRADVLTVFQNGNGVNE